MNGSELSIFLEKLGLTEYEAKTLGTLFNLMEAEAPEISRSAQVPKTRVYDVLDRLTLKGLIIEITGRPKKYRVIEPKTVFEKLLTEKKDELSALEQKAGQLKEKFSLEAGFDKGKNEKIMKVKEKADFYKILAQELKNAKESVYAFTGTGKDFYSIKESLKANPNKLDVKLIGKTSIENTKHVEEITSLGGKIKEHDHGIHAYIIDSKKVIMALNNLNEDKPEYHFTIWPENQPLANALNHYFDKLWEK
jgi:sugar-specific transcriptional regulator TrmB